MTPPIVKSGPSNYLLPGEAAVHRGPGMVATVLGSCVALVVFHPRQQTGGLFHAIMPRCAHFDCCHGTCQDTFRYADCATRWILNTFIAMGNHPEELVVKLFGGAESFGGAISSPTISVGKDNVRVVLNMLQAAGYPPKAMDVGGRSGRKLIFHPHTGDVFIKRLGSKILTHPDIELPKKAAPVWSAPPSPGHP